jgi:hypothetical protein
MRERKVHQTMIPSPRPGYIMLVGLLLALSLGTPAAAGIDVALGDTVPLSGYSSGSPWVYLFLTGPNLPANGVQLNDITKPADQGYFTRVDLDSSDHWEYKWNTGNLGGKLDAGTYTIWVVNGPNDVSRLAQADYRTIPVNLGKPLLAVDTPQQRGAMEITSSPSGASVTLNDQVRGRTPLQVNDLTPGTYQVTFALDGYHEFGTPVVVQAGRVSEVTATLVARTPSPAVNTTPAETASLTPGKSPVSTQKAAGLVPVILLLGLLFLARGLSR